MKFSLVKTYGYYISTLLTVVILSVSILSMTHFGMGMRMEGNAGDCPFLSTTHSMCDVGTFAHISMWRELFAATLPPIYILLLALFTFLSALAYVIAPPLRVLDPLHLRFAYQYTHAYFLPPGFLKEAFSRGILNPKLF